MKKSFVGTLLAVVLVTWCSVGAIGNSAPEYGVAQGGRSLAWCLRGIRWWAVGHTSDNDLLEVAGGVLAYLGCR
jgi:hypothetical protein